MATLDAARAAFQFFSLRRLDGADFTIDEFKLATGWRNSTPRTYFSKKWKDFLEKTDRGRWRVKLEFARMTEDAFLEHFSQQTPIFSRYERVRYESIVTYQFLLPLSREHELRSILDELFYADSIEVRVKELGIDEASQWFPRLAGEDDVKFLARVTSEVGELFGGYSVSRVEGRFRTRDLLPRADAAALLASHGRYVIDETTASVLFIIRMSDSASAAFDQAGPKSPAEQLDRIRRMFIALFAEAVVRIVKEEDEIWLIEGSDDGSRLFVWQREARLRAS